MCNRQDGKRVAVSLSPRVFCSFVTDQCLLGFERRVRDLSSMKQTKAPDVMEVAGEEGSGGEEKGKWD